MAVIKIDNLSFSIGGSRLLDSISFELHAGQVLAVCGPNGAGKSTLLKCLAGQVSPSGGSIALEGRPLQEIPWRDLARRRAVLPQQGRVPFDFTAFEIVQMGRSPHGGGTGSPADRRIAEAALQETDASHLASRTVTTLSGGELARVHMARVLAQIWEAPPRGPRILLLDEPTASLDLHHQFSLLQTAQSWSRQNVAVLVVLHDLNLAAAFADQILLLKGGRLAANDAPESVLTREILRDVFSIETLVIPHPVNAHPLVIPSIPVEAPLNALKRDSHAKENGADSSP